MRKIYDAEHIIDAYLVKGWLEQHDIPCFIHGEYLPGAIGELPVSGLVTIWVPEPYQQQAMDVIDQFLPNGDEPIVFLEEEPEQIPSDLVPLTPKYS